MSIEVNDKKFNLDVFLVVKPFQNTLSSRFYRLLDDWGPDLRPNRPSAIAGQLPRLLNNVNRESLELDLVALEQNLELFGSLCHWRWQQPHHHQTTPDTFLKRWMFLHWLEARLSQ